MDLWWVLPQLLLVLLGRWLLRAILPQKVPEIQVDSSDVVLNSGVSAEEKATTGQEERVGPHTVRCYEPATLKFLGFVPAQKPDDVKSHISQARDAQKVWANSSFEQRRQFLRILLKYILEHQELICQVSARDSGKTMVDAALGEIITTCAKIDWLIKEGERWLKPEYRSSGMLMRHKSARVEFQPLGVIGAIVPWNYPFHNIFNPMLAAVFAGNGIVIKVSEHASWSGAFYSRIIQAALSAAGASTELVHVIAGYGETGEALVSSVDKVIFVGSTAVGKKVMENAAKSLTPVVLELGGKDAFIVCEDADLSQALQIATRATLQSSGQNCAGAERFYVHRDIYSTFVQEISKIVKSIRVGPPFAKQVDMGAICMPGHADRIESLVQEAIEKGAKIVASGQLIKGSSGDGPVGQFYVPTVLVNVNHTMRVMQEEIFGPIICVMPFDSDNEVIELANDSNFGLGCSVFSADRKRANRIASKISCGMVAINDFMATYMCQALPFGGVKDSGFDRLAGVEGLRGCCLAKAIAEDRIPYVKTMIPKPLQYPVAANAFEFQEALIRFLYGLTIQAKLKGLLEVIRTLVRPGPSADGLKKVA